MNKKIILFLFGTRPEAIKLAPLIVEFKKNIHFETKICLTGQHREMVDQVLRLFSIIPDYDLNLMMPNQSLSNITARSLIEIGKLLEEIIPDLIFVQGDTSTAFASALAAFYKRIKVVHIEAGLRTLNKYFPFPEEINRTLISRIADYHFAPTPKAKENLEKENIIKNVWVVGNTVIDALLLSLNIITQNGEQLFYDKFKQIDFSKKIILVTCHRREIFGEPFKKICESFYEIAQNQDVEIVYPIHLNPNIKNFAHKYLNGRENIKLIAPLPYSELVWFMDKSYLVLTDSGGIQEEAPSLGKPVLVLRNETERTEGIEAGNSKLVGTKKNDIVDATNQLLFDTTLYNSMRNKANPYGDGTSSQKIYTIINKILN